MKIRRLHGWNLTPKQAIRLQNRLKSGLRFPPYNKVPRTVAGADLAFHPAGRAAHGKKTTAWGCVIVFKVHPQSEHAGRRSRTRIASNIRNRFHLEEVERVFAKGNLKFPYVPGLLTFREAPILLKAFAKLNHKPDVVFFDAHGTAHPRGFGEACHLGLWLKSPTLGVAKSILVGTHGVLGAHVGNVSWLKHEGRVIGAALRTREHTRPVYVSPGHLMDLSSALRLALACSNGTRIPVPTREADHWSKELRHRETRSKP